MWEAPERGKLTGTIQEFSKLLRATNGDFSQFLEDIKNHKFCDLVTHPDKKLTLINRRMFREQKFKENHNLRQQRYLKRQKNDKKMTPPSSSSSPSPKKYILTDDEFLTSLKEKFTWIDFDQAMVRMDAWLLAHPNRKKTRRFIVGWLNKIDKPIEIKAGESRQPPITQTPEWIKEAVKDGWKG